MAPWIFLAVSLVGASCTLGAWLRGRNIGFLVIPFFFASWLTAELAPHHIVWQALATVAFIAGGALHAWPGFLGLAITLASWAGLVALQRRAATAGSVCDEALRQALGDTYRSLVPPRIAADLPTAVEPRLIMRPFKTRVSSVERIANIAYGDAGTRNLLDVYRPRSGLAGCPILLQIHGGGWIIGNKDQQGLPLMNFLSARGWVCVAPNYRLSPKATFPEHLIDIKRTLAWIQRHAAEYGADPAFVAVTGGSAGGHLAALTALTPNDPTLQPGFEEVDTSVAACVPIYGVYDFLDRQNLHARQSMTPFIEKYIMKCSPESARERWDKASPVALVRADAPPFFVIHGTHDSLTLVEGARLFVSALRAVSRNPVAYAELPGAQHAFDLFHSLRCGHAVNAIGWFLEYIRACGAQRLCPSTLDYGPSPR
jgi:acetyl esterase/lipase